MENEEILNCIECEQRIKENDKVVSIEVGDLEIDLLDGSYINPLIQGSSSVGIWHLKCYLDGHGKPPLRDRVRETTKE